MEFYDFQLGISYFIPTDEVHHFSDRYKNHQPDGRGGIITTTGEAIHSSRGLLFETWGTYQFSSRHGGLFPELSSTKLGATSLEKHQEVRKISKMFKVFPWDGKS